jgi:[acyl-carrier-protein] S-malonyltransferase
VEKLARADWNAGHRPGKWIGTPISRSARPCCSRPRAAGHSNHWADLEIGVPIRSQLKISASCLGVFVVKIFGMSKTALLFAGQGAQIVGMGKDLAEQFPSAKAWFDRANAALGYDLAGICFNGPEAELTKTEHAQPGIFLVSWVCFELLKEQVGVHALACSPDTLKRELQLKFDATAGLSLGEFTALTAAGAMSFEDGLRVVRQRGKFMQEACDVTKGGMAAIIGLDENLTREVCAEAGVVLANLNCPGQIVISGEAEKIVKACELAKAKGAKRALPLPVAGAYHSPLMASAQPKLAAELAKTKISAPIVPVISNVTAQAHVVGQASSLSSSKAEHQLDRLEACPAISARLVEQVCASVRWEESMRALLAQGFTCFIELGPGTALSGFMKRIDKSAQMLNVADAASLEATVKVSKKFV